MKLSQQSQAIIESAIQKAINKYTCGCEQTIVTDIHIQPNQNSGELFIYDDEDEEPKKKSKKDKKEVKERGNDMGMPEIILEKLTGESKIADQLLEDTGVYEVITQKMVQMTIQGVAYIIVFVLILIATRFIFIAFKIVDKLPLIGGINRAIGAVAGFVKGMVIVWIVFACVAMTVTTSFGQEIVQAIYASPLLIWLYENNLILTLLMNIL